MNEALNAYAECLARMVGGVFPKGSENALYASISINYLETRSDTPYFPLGCTVHLVLYSPHNYVTVYGALTARPVMSPLDLPWVHLSSHDTTWRQDGIRSTLRDAHQAVRQRVGALFPTSKFSVHPHFSLDKLEVLPIAKVIGTESVLRGAPLARLNCEQFMAGQVLEEAEA